LGVIEAPPHSHIYELSPTLAINERVRAARDRGKPILHLGFGEARLPVPAILSKELGAAATANSYGDVDGGLDLRTSVANWFERRGTPTGADQVIVTPGSKAALIALLLALPGDLVLPRPSWVSYAAQARLVDKAIIWCDVPDSTGGVPDAVGLRVALEEARLRGRDPGILFLTIPDNPTSTYPDSRLLAQIVAVAREFELTIVADEIYRDLAFDPASVPSTVALAPERTYLTTGLSKALSLGGWRVGVARVPASESGKETMRRLQAIASEIWSCLPAPIASAAKTAFDEPPEIAAYIASARAVHATLVREAYARLARVGCDCRPPQAAFYLYPGFAASGIRSDVELQRRLLNEANIATLPGSAFGDDPARVRLRLATTIMCGDTVHERWETMRIAESGDLLDVPRIAAALEALEAGFRRVVA
jgi:aspartate aminotransferase